MYRIVAELFGRSSATADPWDVWNVRNELGNVDDRIVAIGGTGQYLPLFGDDALANSCEIFLPPDAGALPTVPLP